LRKGVLLGVGVVAFFAILGGMKGVTWTQAAQYAVLIIAYLIPAVAIAYLVVGNPVPQLAFAFSDIGERLNRLQTELGFTEYTQPFQSKPMIDVLAIMAALMAGTAGLPHIIIRFYTTPDVRSARYSAFWALVFIGLLYTTAPALAMFARYNLINTLHGKPIEQVLQIDWVAKWNQTGLLKIVDKNGDGIVQIAKGKAFKERGGKPDFSTPDYSNRNEVYLDNDIIVLATPEVAQLAPFVIALLAAGGLAAALSTASGLLIAMSSAVSHDLYYRVFNPRAPERLRLLVGRLMMVPALVAAAYLGINPPGFVAQVVAFAFGLAASGLFPAILLGIFDRRMNKQGSDCGDAGRAGLHDGDDCADARPTTFRGARTAAARLFRHQRGGHRYRGDGAEPHHSAAGLTPHATAACRCSGDGRLHSHPARRRGSYRRVKQLGARFCQPQAG
jgi:cation/acetate symporter